MVMQWVKCSERLPTESDGDDVGNVFVRSIVAQPDKQWAFFFVLQYKYVNRKHHYEWLAGACEREGEGSE